MLFDLMNEIENKVFLDFKEINQYKSMNIFLDIARNLSLSFDILLTPIGKHTLNFDFTFLWVKNIAFMGLQMLIVPFCIVNVIENHKAPSIVEIFISVILIEMLLLASLLLTISLGLLSVLTRPAATLHYLFKTPHESKPKTNPAIDNFENDADEYPNYDISLFI
jgi:hypothetical protein